MGRDPHAEEDRVAWNAEHSTVEVSNVDPAYNYLLITNSLRLPRVEPRCRQTVCPSCEAPVSSLEYEFCSASLTEGEFREELGALKFCILLIHKETSTYEGMLGTI